MNPPNPGSVPPPMPPGGGGPAPQKSSAPVVVIVVVICVVLFLGVAVVGVLAAIAVPGFIRARERALLAKSMTNARSLHTACLIYSGDHGGEFPPSLAELGSNHLLDRTALVDPFAQELGEGGYNYYRPAQRADGSTVVIISRGKSKDGKRVIAQKDGQVRAEGDKAGLAR
jgi:type II secretory pathway pseudopilin PulG